MAMNPPAFQWEGTFAGFAPAKDGKFYVKLECPPSGVPIREGQKQVLYECLSVSVPAVAPGTPLRIRGVVSHAEFLWAEVNAFGKPTGKTKPIKDWVHFATVIEPLTEKAK